MNFRLTKDKSIRKVPRVYKVEYHSTISSSSSYSTISFISSLLVPLSIQSDRYIPRMSLPVTSALAGLAWYLVAQSSANDIHPSFVSSLINSLPVAHSTLTSLAKWAFGLTSVHYLSSELTAFARNNWRLSDAHRWNWKEEVAVVTGGCSGIGEEMVKALSRKGVKVVILDVTELPERLQGCEFIPNILLLHGMKWWSS